MMKLGVLAMLFLFIACIQAISASDFHTNSTSSKLQTQELLEGRLYGSIKGKVVKFEEKVEEKKNKQMDELSSTSRKAHTGKGATGGSSDVNRRPRQNFAPSLFSRPLFCASVLTLYVSLALIFVLAFPFY